MADNIRIVGSILNTTQVSRYDISDLRLITSQKIKKSFGSPNDYIEYHVYDIGDNPLEASYNYLGYQLPKDLSLNPGASASLNTRNRTVSGDQVGSTTNLTTSSTYPVIEIDPVQDLQNLGYTSGEFKVQYNIFKNQISSFPSASLFIKEISPDRTELRVGSVVLSNSEIESGSLKLINTYNSSSTFDPYLLNFGNNIQEVVTNIVLNKIDTGYEILFKLYNGLDPNIGEKSSLWVVEEISTPYIFNINLDAILSAPTGSNLRGPNFRAAILKNNTTSTEYKDLNDLSSTAEELQNLNVSQSISINVNYSGNDGTNGGFSSFVTFGSALSRVQNFYTKVQQIENYNSFINTYTPYVAQTSSLQSEINSYTSSINDIIANFDGFENYLYFESGSLISSDRYGVTPYPKSGSNRPYTLLPSNSTSSSLWYSNTSDNAADYDVNNKDYFVYSVPSYVVDDPNNANYITFINMVGQFFDNILIYVKSLTDINKSNNNLNIGISKDIVYSTLQSLGINVFNSLGNQDIILYLIGSNTGSANYSGSLNDFSVTSSYLNNIPKQDLLAESYKRIYHNLPLLLQRKGTIAGLQNLLSIFGISSRNYYTVISGSVTSTYYTPTGSLMSSSILSIKEFGGEYKTNALNEYNNDKVRIVDDAITGKVLSPYISIVQYASESSKFRSLDSQYVDISFSPQLQIDSHISKSISSSNSNWILDNYIGDPRQLYSSSYEDLIAQQKIYFSQGTGSYPGFTGSLLDYNSFSRLIQFFDNSLFKMIEDFVPARVNLTTGITMNSPVLERNKVSYARPNYSSNQFVYTTNIQTSSFYAPYDRYYNYLPGDRKEYFNGALSGSELNIYDNYFIPNNFNPYLYNTSSYNTGLPPELQVDYSEFIHSDFNVLLNNITRSIESPSRLKLEISGSTGILGSGSYAIFTTSSLQNSYLSLDSYILSRHNGVKISSAKYNLYTSASSNYEGDISYGKEAVIDHYVKKFGLFTQIVSSSFFYSRNLVALKYLVDESGSLTELNQNDTLNSNSHWYELQNTFKLGTNSTITLFDNQKFSDQKSTDGPKTIFDTGYSYSPLLYYTGSDNKLFFQYVGKGTSILAQFNNSGFFISGSTPLRYTASVTSNTGSIFTVFDTPNPNFSNGNSNYTLGTATNFPTYSVPQNTNMAFSANFGINFQFPVSQNTASFTFSSASLSKFVSPTGSFIVNGVTVAVTGSTLPANNATTFFVSTGSTAINTIASIVTAFNFSRSLAPYSASIQYISASTSASNAIIFRATSSGAGEIGNTYYVTSGSTTTYFTGGENRVTYKFDIVASGSGFSNLSLATQTQTFTSSLNASPSTIFTFNVTSAFRDFNPGDQISFQLSQYGLTTNNFTASLARTGDGTIYSGLQNSLSTTTTGINPFVTSSGAPFLSGSNGNNILVFSKNLTNFLDYLYLPATSSAILYPVYGNANITFSPKIGDIIILYYNQGTQFQELNISNVTVSNSKLNLTVTPNLVSNLISESYDASTVNGLLLLSKISDETNINLTFDKVDGQTSYGFLIPENLSPDILKNIDKITKQVKQKLLSDQSTAISNINGGTFG
jgi:hypothetical protein